MQSVFITGVSSGLGMGLAEYYLQRGDRVFGCSRRTPDDLLADDNFHFIACDLANFELVPEKLEQLLGTTSDCDLVILNAGILSPFGDLQEISMGDCQHVMNVNVWANKAVLDWLVPRSPKLQQVVTISSGAAVNGSRGWNVYSISKAALNMLTTLYAREVEGSHFLAIAPGLIDTHMQDVLCGLPADDRFPSLETLRQRQGTTEMPTGNQLAPRIARVIDAAPDHVDSGSFVDIRQISW